MKSSKANEDARRPRSSSTSENTKPLPVPAVTHGHSPYSIHSHNGHFHAHPSSAGIASTHLGAPFGVPRGRCDSLPTPPRQASESFFDQPVNLPARCNTIGAHTGQTRPWSAGGSGAASPLEQLHGHSSTENCAEEPQPQGAARGHLHLNVTATHVAPHGHQPPQSIVEESGGEVMSEYLTMNSPGQLGSTGSLIGSPVTLTDGGPSSMSSGHGAHSLPPPPPHTVDSHASGSYFLAHQPSSGSSTEYMRMSPSHDASSGASSSSINLNNNNNNNNGGGNNNSSSSSCNNVVNNNVNNNANHHHHHHHHHLLLLQQHQNNNNNNNNNNNIVQDVTMSSSPAAATTTTTRADGGGDPYMSMGQVGSQAVASNNILNSGTLPNGYVPMEPPSSASSTMVISGSVPRLAAPGLRGATRGISESSPMSPHGGYMEMAPLSSSLPKSVGAFSGSWGSSIHSLHESSTPFNLNVEDFQLEKVRSFIAAGDGDDDQSVRTGRSFSCGKRPSDQRGLGRSGPASGLGSERVRAYSVGSQANYPAAMAAAAKKRQQQQLQQQQSQQLQDAGTPTSDRGRSNSYSKKSSSTSTLGSRHSEEFMEINYDENWHRTTASASAAFQASSSLQANLSSHLSATGGGGCSTNCSSAGGGGGGSTSNNNMKDCEYLTMMRVPGYKESDSTMKLFPLKEVEVSPSPKESSKDTTQDRHRFAVPHSSNAAPISASCHSAVAGRTGHSEYMDFGQLTQPSRSAQAPTYGHRPPSTTADNADGEYVSLDMSRPWQTRSLSLCGAPEPKKSKSELSAATLSLDVNMTPTLPAYASPTPAAGVAAGGGGGGGATAFTTTQHNYENLSFGANGATIDAVSSSQDNQEPMDTDQSTQRLPPPPPTPAPSPTPDGLASSAHAIQTHGGLSTSLVVPAVSLSANPVPISGPRQAAPGNGGLASLNVVCHELNYASLDLPPASDEPASPVSAHEGGAPGAAIVPSALGLANGMSLGGASTIGVSYSEVDFPRSEGLRGSMLREGGRV
ncbi:hypothetical protein BIW11_08593 [Tropilaelaps mercedesae]|uniref:Uncharacterized protein n=1 Tax=Tropilaelaps mercedesae TaxID=418985 RepID=A0A1V9XNV6_9ACAR|nr:hypothetical protein BIW11_08593 [Tropilaelaps mercedesae]